MTSRHAITACTPRTTKSRSRYTPPMLTPDRLSSSLLPLVKVNGLMQERACFHHTEESAQPVQ